MIFRPKLSGKVADLVRRLAESTKSGPKRKLDQRWAGALKRYRDQYTSLQLSRKHLSGAVTLSCTSLTRIIWLERLLEQTPSEEVGRFLERFPGDKLYLTDFTSTPLASFRPGSISLQSLISSLPLLDSLVRAAFVLFSGGLPHLSSFLSPSYQCHRWVAGQAQSG